LSGRKYTAALGWEAVLSESEMDFSLNTNKNRKTNKFSIYLYGVL
jgi:hypothetical protein